MGLDRNIELLGNESLKLNELFDNFSNVHEDIQELLTTKEQLVDSQIHDKMRNCHIFEKGGKKGNSYMLLHYGKKPVPSPFSTFLCQN